MGTACKILIVDDSEDDRFFLERGFKKLSGFDVVGQAADGELAIQYLSGKGSYADRERYPFPDLVCLDLKMPRLNGFEVLEWMRTQSFNDLQVVVVSTSNLPVDVDRAKALGALDYVIKNNPPDSTALAIARIVQNFGGGTGM